VGDPHSGADVGRGHLPCMSAISRRVRTPARPRCAPETASRGFDLGAEAPPRCSSRPSPCPPSWRTSPSTLGFDDHRTQNRAGVLQRCSRTRLLQHSERMILFFEGPLSTPSPRPPPARSVRAVVTVARWESSMNRLPMRFGALRLARTQVHPTPPPKARVQTRAHPRQAAVQPPRLMLPTPIEG
jgi:hypothetical protein